MGGTDEHGTPYRGIYQERVADRLVAELLGLCKGLIADGIVNEDEAIALRQWMRANPDVAAQFPGSVVAARLQRIFEDGEIDDEERVELEQLLQALVGDTPERNTDLDRPTKVVFDSPPPTLFFDGVEYVFTGQFAYGTRKACERAVADRGGRAAKSLTARTRVLVVGTFASPAWITSAYGTKILSAWEMKANGHAIFVVPEEHWVISLSDG